MTDPQIALITVFSYFIACIWQWQRLNSNVAQGKWIFKLISLIAIGLHGTLLHHWIDIAHGQNLTSFNMLSLAFWLVACLMWFMSWFRALDNLALIIFPLAGLSILTAWLLPGYAVFNTIQQPKQLIHILLAVITCAVLLLTALMALLLALQDYLLRRRHAFLLLQHLPPLQTLEQGLFHWLWLGFILLTVVTISAILFFPQALVLPFLIKTILTIFAWIILAILLWGHYRWGWRGQRGVRWTCLGVALVFLVYLMASLRITYGF